MDDRMKEIEDMANGNTVFDGHGDPEVKPKAKEIIDMDEVKAKIEEIEKKVQNKDSYIKSDDYVPKKICAVEVSKHLKIKKTLGVGSIISMFLTLLLSIFNKTWASGFILVVTVAISYVIYKNETEMKRLKANYGV
jgi:hypothetical protein